MRSFTLIELIIVIIILGILATFAMPAFMVTQEKALTKEAIANLKLIAAAEKVYRMEIGSYYPVPPPATEGGIANINNYLRLYFTNETYWDYTVNSTSTSAFDATAARTTGPYAGCTYTITETTPGDPPRSGTCP